MTCAHEPGTFDAWFAKITVPTYPDDPGEISPATRRFLRDLFEAQGPVSREIAEEAYGERIVAFTKEIVAVVLGDLHRTTTYRPRVVVDDSVDMGPRLSIDGNHMSDPLSLRERPEALADTANDFQEHTYVHVGVWPVCEEHGVGLHAEAREHDAVWRCRLGGHDVAVIGRLGILDAG